MRANSFKIRGDEMFKRIKSQKGLSGVMIALLLVVVGIGVVAGTNIWINGQKNSIQNMANNSINTSTTF